MYIFRLNIHPLECLPYICLHPHSMLIGMVMRVYVRDNLTQNNTVGSMLALYGSTMHVATL